MMLKGAIIKGLYFFLRVNSVQQQCNKNTEWHLSILVEQN